MLRGRLVLGLLVTAPADWRELAEEVEATATDLGMTVEIEPGTGDTRHRRAGRSHVTVTGSPLTATEMAALTARIAECGANIDKIDRPRGMDITVVTTATTDDQGRALLRALGFPFKEN